MVGSIRLSSFSVQCLRLVYRLSQPRRIVRLSIQPSSLGDIPQSLDSLGLILSSAQGCIQKMVRAQSPLPNAAGAVVSVRMNVVREAEDRIS